MSTIEYEGNEVEDNYSDVSLEEEDEDLIWRVFYSALEKGGTADSSEDEDEDDYTLDESEDLENMTDLSDVDDPELVAKYKELKQMKFDKYMSEEDKKRLLIANFTDKQMERFEAYRRMTVNKPGVKKICNSVLGHSIPQNIAVILAGISKLFLGEVITKALEIQERENKARLILDIHERKKQKREILNSLERGQEVEIEHRRLQYDGDKVKPLQPNHIREAWRILKLENSGNFASQWRCQGDADGKFFR